MGPDQVVLERFGLLPTNVGRGQGTKTRRDPVDDLARFDGGFDHGSCRFHPLRQSRSQPRTCPPVGYFDHLVWSERASVDDYLGHPVHGTESITWKPRRSNTVVCGR